MAAKTLTDVLRDIGRKGRLRADLALPDAELMQRFLSRRDDCAFAALVARHGPLVFGVCRRLLADPNDAEDAFQATFLILVRKADSIARPDLLGHWLYGVAFRVASRVRKSARRRATEPIDPDELPAPERADTELAWLVHDEVQRLPERYREAVLLCCLEGKTSEEAAEQLCCPVGTVKGRLHRARALLRSRLSRQGLALSAGLLGAGTARALPPLLLDTTIRAASSFAAGDATAGGLASLKAIALTKGVLHTMMLTKMKAPLLLVLFLAVLGLGMGLTWHTTAAEPGPRRVKTRLVLREKPAEKARTDKELILGKWKVVRVEADGKDVSDLAGEPQHYLDSIWEVTADKMVGKKGDLNAEMSYKLDPSAKPKKIDMTVVSGAEKGAEGKTLKAVYTLEGDTLKICGPIQIDGDRPTEVKTREGDKTMMLIFQREKAKEKEDREAAKDKDDKELLQGKWKVVAVEAEGRDVTNEEGANLYKDSVWEIIADKITMRMSRDRNAKMTFKLDLSTNPKAIDVTEKVEGKTLTLKGVYTLEGDRLKLCLANPEQDRPAEVATNESSTIMLFILKREKARK